MQDQRGGGFGDTHRPELDGPALVPGPDRAAGGAALADPHQEGSPISGERLVWHRTRSCGAFMCGCFGDIRGAERPAFSCARHALGGAGTLYEALYALKWGVFMNGAVMFISTGCLLRVGCSAFSTVQTG